MLGLTLALTLSLAGQDQTVPPAPPQDPLVETEVEGITVEAELDSMSLDVATRTFVRAVAAPVDGRGLAQWHRPICAAVVNFGGEGAQYMVDRIHTVAADLGLPTREPGCTPNILVVFAADGAEAADRMVEDEPMNFRIGVGGLDRGSAALRRFRTEQRPVRWWQVSAPTDPTTGARVFHLPGDAIDNYAQDQPNAPIIMMNNGSRLNNRIRDYLARVVIVIDVDEVGGIAFTQLVDYVALIAMAQVDPDGDTSAFTTILNVFDDPQATPELSDWDWSYLKALYGPRSEVRGSRGQMGEVAGEIARDQRRE